MRIIKEPEVRKNEILDAAERLFAARGFEKATVNDILNATGIAKGTFYYYFKSKEEVLDAIIRRRIDAGLEKAKAIAANPQLSPVQKIVAAIMAQQPQSQIEEEFLPVLHEPVNALFHQKVLTDTVIRLSPVLSDIVKEGIKQGVFSTAYPEESVEILLTAGLVIFDDAYFPWSREEQAARIPAFLGAMERILGAKNGSFSEFAIAFDQGRKEKV